MCGRFTNKADRKQIESEFEVKIKSDIELFKSYNIAPSQYVGAVRLSKDNNKEFINLKWGLVPFWAKDESFASKLINARSETLSKKASYREAYKTRRCLIPASGFYEWEKTSSGKQPHYYYLREKEVFGFGGLWEEWLDKESDELVESCTIITTEANELLEKIHNRMPVIINQTDYENWLDNEKFDKSSNGIFFEQFPANKMASHKVSRKVNSPVNNTAELVEPISSK